jgi:hypothetical protein
MRERPDHFRSGSAGLPGLLAQGRTVTNLFTAASKQEIEELAEQHGRCGVDDYDWKQFSPTQKLDCIATSLLGRNREDTVQKLRDRIDVESRQKTAKHSARYKKLLGEARGHYLSPWQYYFRSRSEVVLDNLDFLDRTHSSTDWKWHEGGWYGDAPRIIQEHYPKVYDGVTRSSGADKVGIFWSPPRGTSGR